MAVGHSIVNRHGHTVGGTKSKTYRCWRAMMQRCYRVKDRGYKKYGARGVGVCERWHDFRNFLVDMGSVPSGMTLDRINSAGNYEPSNCRWATYTTQCRNRSITLTLTFNGETRPTAEWAEITGINYQCLRGRIDRGWSAEKALTTKKMSHAEISALGAKARKEKALKESRI